MVVSVLRHRVEVAERDAARRARRADPRRAQRVDQRMEAAHHAVHFAARRPEAPGDVRTLDRRRAPVGQLSRSFGAKTLRCPIRGAKRWAAMKRALKTFIARAI